MITQTLSPQHAERLFVDKLSIQFPTDLFSQGFPSGFEHGPVTMVQFGLFTQVKFHDEYLRNWWSPGAGGLHGLVALARCGIFKESVRHQLEQAWSAWYFGGIPSLPNPFKSEELELTVDVIGPEEVFYTHPTGHLRQRYRTTFYTGDYKAYFRSDNRLKGVRKSFFIVYRKDLQVGSPAPVTRFEWRFKGVHNRHLTPSVIFLPVQGIYQALLPILRRQSKKLGIGESLDIRPSVGMMPGSLISQLMADLFGPEVPRGHAFGGYN